MKAVIFDFNRTLYNPESQCLEDKAKETLTRLKELGYLLILYGKGDEKRQNLLKETGITKFFKEVLISEEKSAETMREIIERNKITIKESYSIGDRVKKEIAISNKLGLKTIWLKKGKFSTEYPQSKEETPNYTIHGLEEIRQIIKK